MICFVDNSIKGTFMTHAEVTKLMAENMRIIGRMSNRLQPLLDQNSKGSRQQMSILVRLYLTGKTKLKDFANHEFISTANLCGVFRKLEADRLVMRSIDEQDHRNMWYEVTKSGKALAEKLIDKLMRGLESLCKVLPTKEEDKLAETVKTINDILKKMEALNA